MEGGGRSKMWTLVVNYNWNLLSMKVLSFVLVDWDLLEVIANQLGVLPHTNIPSLSLDMGHG